MAKFTFTTQDDFGGKTTLDFDGLILSDVLERFESFLLGAGYRFDGKLDFVDDFQSEKCGGNCSSCSCDKGEDVFANMVDNWPNMKEPEDDGIFISDNDIHIDLSNYGAACETIIPPQGVDTITITSGSEKKKNANKR